jgi:hypothetical protein
LDFTSGAAVSIVRKPAGKLVVRVRIILKPGHPGSDEKRRGQGMYTRLELNMDVLEGMGIGL